MLEIPIEKAFASCSYTVVSAASVTHDDPLSTKRQWHILDKKCLTMVLTAVTTRYATRDIFLSISLSLMASIIEGKKTIALAPCSQY